MQRNMGYYSSSVLIHFHPPSLVNRVADFKAVFKELQEAWNVVHYQTDCAQLALEADEDAFAKLKKKEVDEIAFNEKKNRLRNDLLRWAKSMNHIATRNRIAKVRNDTTRSRI